MSMEVGIRDLKNGLSDFIDRVEAGEIVTVTRRGKPVARVIPHGHLTGDGEAGRRRKGALERAKAAAAEACGAERCRPDRRGVCRRRPSLIL